LRGEIAERRMDVGVDKPRHHGRAARVDDGIEAVVVEAGPDSENLAVPDQHRIGIEQRVADVAADELPNVPDEGCHRTLLTNNGYGSSARGVGHPKVLAGAARVKEAEQWHHTGARKWLFTGPLPSV